MSGSYWRFSADQSRAEELATQNEMAEALTALVDAPSGGGTVTTTGSPASGNLTKFSGATSIVNGDLSGDVTTSGTLTTTIANSVVTLAKIQNAAANSKLIGSGSAGSGSPYSEITLGTGLSMSGTTLSATGATLADGDYGDITASSSGTTLTIDPAVVTFAKIQNATANSKLVGSGASGSGASYAEITLGTGLSMTGTTLNVTGATLADGDYGDITVSGGGTVVNIDAGVVGTTELADGSVTVAKLQSGTSFPGSPSTDDLFYRTDLRIWCFYDGTHWLSTTLYSMPISAPTALQTLSATTTLRENHPHAGDFDIYCEKFKVVGILTSGTTGTNYFTGRLAKGSAGSTTNLGAGVSLQNNTQNEWTLEQESINAVIENTAPALIVTLTEAATATAVIMASITYRLVLT